MSREVQEQIRRDRQQLCQVQYPGTDQPSFVGARCKKAAGHVGKHKTWRRSQGKQIHEDERYNRIYLEWSERAAVR